MCSDKTITRRALGGTPTVKGRWKQNQEKRMRKKIQQHRELCSGNEGRSESGRRARLPGTKAVKNSTKIRNEKSYCSSVGSGGCS